MQSDDLLLKIPSRSQIDPIDESLTDIEKDLIKDIATATDIIEEIVFNEKSSKPILPIDTTTLHSDNLNNTPSTDSVLDKTAIYPNSPIERNAKHIERKLFKKITPSTDIIKEIIVNEKYPKPIPPTDTTTLRNNNLSNALPTDSILDKATVTPNDSIENDASHIEKKLIKDIAAVTRIIEKIITNKDYSERINKNNTLSKKAPLELHSTPTTSAEYIAIEENLVKDIAAAMVIIDNISSKEIYANSPILKNPINTNKSEVAKKIGKIITEAIVSPNLIALEKSIRELLAKKSIFTNFKA